tara:strand:- start:3892 stop:4971 length:1080 start_codon:yes stop_codon:yes gene_type:complete
MTENKSVSFIAFTNRETLSIEQKVNDYCLGLSSQGFKAVPKIIQSEAISERIIKGFSIWRDESEILIVRNSIYTPFLLFSLILSRLRNKKIIIEVPTPLKVMASEVRNSHRNFIRKILLLIIIYLSFPYSLWPSNRILNYSAESRYFSFGLKKRSKLVTNGINVENIPVLSSDRNIKPEPFVMVAVAMFQSSHGYDRMIRSIHSYLRKPDYNHKKAVKFYIVGDGPLRKEWEELTNKLGINEEIIFTGIQKGEKLHEIFSNAHIAVGSLTPYRNRMSIASEIKLREYCARGIPFIKTTEDPDFPNELDFIFHLENSDKIINLDEIIDWYQDLTYPGLHTRIRGYAKMKLDYKKKELLYL